MLKTPLADGTALHMRMAADVQSLPWLQIWHGLRPGCGRLAIEPCASQWMPGGMRAPVAALEPGESQRYRSAIEFQRQTAAC